MWALRTDGRSDRPIGHVALCPTRDDIRNAVRSPGIRVKERIMTPRNSHLHDLSESSDQELVNLYLELAETLQVDVGPSNAHRIQQAASAAHALEKRGYLEQSGIWIHIEKPHLRATA